MLGHLVVRALAALLGLLVAFPAACLFLVGGVHGGWFSDFFSQWEATRPDADDFALVTIVLVTLMVTGKAAASGALPALAAVVFGEAARWRGLVANLGLGAAVAAATAWAWTGGAPGAERREILAVLSAGFVGGFVYWAIAGRSAGRWLDGGRRKRL